MSLNILACVLAILTALSFYFGVIDFYPSISKLLLDKVINWQSMLLIYRPHTTLSCMWGKHFYLVKTQHGFLKIRYKWMVRCINEIVHLRASAIVWISLYQSQWEPISHFTMLVYIKIMIWKYFGVLMLTLSMNLWKYFFDTFNISKVNYFRCFPNI